MSSGVEFGAWTTPSRLMNSVIIVFTESPGHSVVMWGRSSSDHLQTHEIRKVGRRLVQVFAGYHGGFVPVIIRTGGHI